MTVKTDIRDPCARRRSEGGRVLLTLLGTGAASAVRVARFLPLGVKTRGIARFDQLREMAASRLADGLFNSPLR